MRRRIGRLTTAAVRNAKPKPGKRRLVLADGGNLVLECSRASDGSVYRSWLFRYEFDGVRHDMGIGATHTVGLGEARHRARGLRQLLLDGLDPLTERRKHRQALRAERAKEVTFREVAAAYLALHLGEFRNAKHRQQWTNTLATYAYPKIGHMPVATIGPADVLRVIEPIWSAKRETASRVRQRIERILDYAATRELRSGDNPAARVIASLPKGRNGRTHHAALPFAELPQFMMELRGRTSLSARAIEFTILCSARTGETIGADFEEFDLKARVWVIPAQRMKGGREHRVPLSDRAVQILRTLPRNSERAFPLHETAMAKALAAYRPGVTVHGFRSSFRDWAAETTAYPNHVVEMALAHSIPSAVEAAYRRGDLFEKRRRLMQAWANFCAKPAATGDVVPLRRVP